MTAAALVRQATATGVTLRLVDGKVKAGGDRVALDAILGQLREHREEIAAFLADAHHTTSELIEAAMRVCDLHGDGEQARAEMRADCLATPAHLQVDLLEHLRSVGGGGEASE